MSRNYRVRSGVRFGSGVGFGAGISNRANNNDNNQVRMNVDMRAERNDDDGQNDDDTENNGDRNIKDRAASSSSVNTSRSKKQQQAQLSKDGSKKWYAEKGEMGSGMSMEETPRTPKAQENIGLRNNNNNNNNTNVGKNANQEGNRSFDEDDVSESEDPVERIMMAARRLSRASRLKGGQMAQPQRQQPTQPSAFSLSPTPQGPIGLNDSSARGVGSSASSGESNFPSPNRAERRTNSKVNRSTSTSGGRNSNRSLGDRDEMLSKSNNKAFGGGSTTRKRRRDRRRLSSVISNQDDDDGFSTAQFESDDDDSVAAEEDDVHVHASDDDDDDDGGANGDEDNVIDEDVIQDAVSKPIFPYTKDEAVTMKASGDNPDALETEEEVLADGQVARQAESPAVEEEDWNNVEDDDDDECAAKFDDHPEGEEPTEGADDIVSSSDSEDDEESRGNLLHSKDYESESDEFDYCKEPEGEEVEGTASASAGNSASAGSKGSVGAPGGRPHSENMAASSLRTSSRAVNPLKKAHRPDTFLQCPECGAVYSIDVADLESLSSNSVFNKGAAGSSPALPTSPSKYIDDFKIDANSRGARTVRCSSCLHEWFARTADVIHGQENAIAAIENASKSVSCLMGKKKGIQKPYVMDEPSPLTVFVRNLSFKATEYDLHDAFGAYGRIVRCEIPCDRFGQPRGFAFVEMSRKDDALRAISMLDGITLLGRSLSLSCAVPRKPSTSLNRNKGNDGGSPGDNGQSDGMDSSHNSSSSMADVRPDPPQLVEAYQKDNDRNLAAKQDTSDKNTASAKDKMNPGDSGGSKENSAPSSGGGYLGLNSPQARGQQQTSSLFNLYNSPPEDNSDRN